MGHRRNHFAATGGGQISEERGYNLAPHVGERVAIEEEKGGAAVALPQEFYGFSEGEDL